MGSSVGGMLFFAWLPLDSNILFRLHNSHEYHVRQNCNILLVVALLGGPGFGVLTKKHLQTTVGATAVVFLLRFAKGRSPQKEFYHEYV